ncbi:MAG: hypothetical protein ABIH89_07870 [Elusimicrobiota bacterium]
MEKSLKEFKEYYLERMLKLLWNQWSALGVAGYGAGRAGHVMDPEALLLLTVSIGRYDPRLFDELMDWLALNSYVFNTQRLKAVCRKERFAGINVVGAVTGYLSAKQNIRKFNRLVMERRKPFKTEDLFYSTSSGKIGHFGNTDPVFMEHGFRRGKVELSGNSREIPLHGSAGLLCRLRSFLGVTARCEIILYLLTHEHGHPSRIAAETCYSQKTVQDTLVEMSKSGSVYVRPEGREKYYWLKQEKWLDFLSEKKMTVKWINWPALFGSLEEIWFALNNKELVEQSQEVQSSELRALMKSLKNKFEKSGLDQCISEDRLYPSKEYLTVFLSDVKKILEQVL